MRMSYLFWKRAIVTLAVMPFASLCLICIFWGFIVGKVYSLNNQILSEYEQVFRETAHPPDTSKVASKRLVTRPPGNGSHCFYFVGEVRSFSGDQARIKGFYADSQVQLQIFENGQLNRFPYDWLSQLTNWEISKASSRDSYYLIYILNSKINDYTSLDLRCS